MKKFAILVDSTSDLSSDLLNEFNIKCLPAFYTTPDHQSHWCKNEYTTEEMADFYNELRKKPNAFTTASNNVNEWKTFICSFAEEYEGILILTLSSSLSGTNSIVNMAKNDIKIDHPNLKIEVIDTKRFSGGIALMAIYASIAREHGHTFEETVKELEIHKNLIHQAGWLDDLSFVAAKGRINRFKAFFGSLAHVKPIGDFDINGLTTVLGSVRGTKKAYKVLLKYIENTIVSPLNQIFVIATTDRKEQALKYKELIQEKFKPKRIIMLDVLPSCAINVGPGLMAAYYIGRPIRESLNFESELLKHLNEDK